MLGSQFVQEMIYKYADKYIWGFFTSDFHVAIMITNAITQCEQTVKWEMG